MARASKSGSPRTSAIARAKEMAARLVTGEADWHDSVRALLTGLLVLDPKGENIRPRRRNMDRVLILDPLAASEPETFP